jgi:hypothetical protein
MTATATSTTAQPGGSLGVTEVRQLIEQTCPTKAYRDKKVLLIVPDGTRTAPIGLLFRALHDQIGPAAKTFDVLIALGTHPPMSEQAICQRLEITRAERSGKYAGVNVYNHEWDNPAALRSAGVIPEAEISELSNGLFSIAVQVNVAACLIMTKSLSSVPCSPTKSSAFPAEINILRLSLGCACPFDARLRNRDLRKWRRKAARQGDTCNSDSARNLQPNQFRLSKPG